nr:dentin sialophosphoprotein-like isoform X3 [Paramormyrops kingsleyae]
MKTKVVLVLCTVVLLTYGFHFEAPVSQPPLSTSLPVTGTTAPQPTVRLNQNFSLSNSSAAGEDLPPSDSAIRNNSAPSGEVPVSGGAVSNDSDSGDAGFLASGSHIGNNSAPSGGGVPVSSGPFSNDSDSSGAGLPAPNGAISNNSAPCGDSPSASSGPIMNDSDSSSTSRSPISAPNSTLQYNVTHTATSASHSSGEDPHGSEPRLDPLLAGLVSVFILTAAVITLLLFLKFRRRNNQPEFRRLQDLPMDDMMEDAPLSMYSY